jgi:hypothetical protein
VRGEPCPNCGARKAHRWIHFNTGLCDNYECRRRDTPHVHTDCVGCGWRGWDEFDAEDMRPVLDAARAEMRARAAP